MHGTASPFTQLANPREMHAVRFLRTARIARQVADRLVFDLLDWMS